MARTLRSSLLRFVLIGAVNTLVDLSIFFILYSQLHASLVLANIVSTSVALIVSYTLNSRYTFAAAVTKRSLIQFVAITLTGLWILQPLIITMLEPIIRSFGFNDSSSLPILGAKVGSIGVTLVWNYLWYKNVVFLDKSTKESNTRGVNYE